MRTAMSQLTLFVGEISSSNQVTELSLTQRKCMLSDEGKLKMWPVYTKAMCSLECRYNNILRICGCYPHFARPTSKCYDLRPFNDCFFIYLLINEFVVIFQTEYQYVIPINFNALVRISTKFYRWKNVIAMQIVTQHFILKNHSRQSNCKSSKSNLKKEIINK